MRNRYCTGCGETFTQTHHLRNHRNTFRCGGRFLPAELREVYDRNRFLREQARREARVFEIFQIDPAIKWRRNINRNKLRVEHHLGRK